MRDKLPELPACKPKVQVKRWWLDLHRRRQAPIEIEGYRVIRRGADRGGHTGKLRKRRAVYMAGGDQPGTTVLLQYGSERFGIPQILFVHMSDAGCKRRMMQEQQRRACCRCSQRCVEPGQRRGFEYTVVHAGHARIDQDNIEIVNR